MIRERVAAAYPGVHKTGLSLWVLEDRHVVSVAVGSVGMAQVASVLDHFAPDLLLVEGSPREGRVPRPFRASGARILFSHDGWRRTSRRQPLGRVGFLAQNAWRMGWHEIVNRGSVKVGILRPEPIEPAWLQAWGSR